MSGRHGTSRVGGPAVCGCRRRGRVLLDRLDHPARPLLQRRLRPGHLRPDNLGLQPVRDRRQHGQGDAEPPRRPFPSDDVLPRTGSGATLARCWSRSAAALAAASSTISGCCRLGAQAAAGQLGSLLSGALAGTSTSTSFAAVPAISFGLWGAVERRLLLFWSMLVLGCLAEGGRRADVRGDGPVRVARPAARALRAGGDGTHGRLVSPSSASLIAISGRRYHYFDYPALGRNWTSALVTLAERPYRPRRSRSTGGRSSRPCSRPSEPGSSYRSSRRSCSSRCRRSPNASGSTTRRSGRPGTSTRSRSPPCWPSRRSTLRRGFARWLTAPRRHARLRLAAERARRPPARGPTKLWSARTALR